MIRNETERGYVAGLLEGEGCFSANRIYGKRRKDGGRIAYLRPFISLNMTDEDVVRRLHRLVGVGSVCRYLPPGNRQPQYRLSLSGPMAIELMLTVRDLMGKRRRAKIDALLATQFGRVNSGNTN